MRQNDLFAQVSPPAPPPSDLPAPDAIRTRLHALLATARAAEAMPWTPERTRVHRLMFYNMANWLPTGERDALRQDFAAELARLSTPA